MITIVGATGKTGHHTAERLLKAGERVRVIGREAGRLQPLVAEGAEAAVGDASDAGFLARAFRGADAVYTLLPPDLAAPDLRALQDRVGEATVRALRESGVPHVVFLSSQGAELPSGTGPIAGLHAQEERLRALGVHVLSLRAGYFMENLHGSLGMIRAQGINGGAIDPGVPIPMIATRDIAEVAAAALRARDFRGFVVRDLLGPRDVTLAEATRILGGKIGKPDLAYVQFPYAGFVEALVGFGFSRDVAGRFAEMARAFNEGRIAPAGRRTPESSTPTPLESFADELAAAYRAQA